MYNWGNPERNRRAPEDFQLPPGGMRQAWQLWCLGSDDSEKGYPPVRLLDKYDMGEDSVPAQRNKRRRLCDLRSVMGKMEKVRFSITLVVSVSPDSPTSCTDAHEN